MHFTLPAVAAAWTGTAPGSRVGVPPVPTHLPAMHALTQVAARWRASEWWWSAAMTTMPVVVPVPGVGAAATGTSRHVLLAGVALMAAVGLATADDSSVKTMDYPHSSNKRACCRRSVGASAAAAAAAAAGYDDEEGEEEDDDGGAIPVPVPARRGAVAGVPALPTAGGGGAAGGASSGGTVKSVTLKMGDGAWSGIHLRARRLDASTVNDVLDVAVAEWRFSALSPPGTTVHCSVWRLPEVRDSAPTPAEAARLAPVDGTDTLKDVAASDGRVWLHVKLAGARSGGSGSSGSGDGSSGGGGSSGRRQMPMLEALAAMAKRKGMEASMVGRCPHVVT